MFINRKENHIVYYGKEYEAHEYIKMNICANRGSHSALFKDNLIELAEDRNIPLSGTETKEQLFDLLSSSGISDLEWEVYGSIGVPSKIYQDFFHITHKDVKRLEKSGRLTVIGSYPIRRFGKNLDVPLYCLSEFLGMKQETIDKWLKSLQEEKRNLLENECKTVTEIIQEVREEVCTRLCKYPERYTPEEWENGAEKICKECPLDRL